MTGGVGGGGGEEWTGTVMCMHRGCVYVVQIFCAWCQVCGSILCAYLVPIRHIPTQVTSVTSLLSILGHFVGSIRSKLISFQMFY